MSKKQYAKRDARELDKAGEYYSRHVHALTAENLRGKHDIAEELAYRDMVIDQQKAEIKRLRKRIEKLEACVVPPDEYRQWVEKQAEMIHV